MSSNATSARAVLKLQEPEVVDFAQCDEDRFVLRMLRQQPMEIGLELQ